MYICGNKLWRWHYHFVIISVHRLHKVMHADKLYLKGILYQQICKHCFCSAKVMAISSLSQGFPLLQFYSAVFRSQMSRSNKGNCCRYSGEEMASLPESGSSGSSGCLFLKQAFTLPIHFLSFQYLPTSSLFQGTLPRILN